MGRGRQELRDEILLLRVEVDDADAATLLALVFGRIGALDVAAGGEDDDGILVGDEILR